VKSFPATADKSAPAVQRSLANATVLVVDDESLVRWSLKERLTREGCTVLEAGTAAAAIRQATAGVDAVLLDYRLPDATGVAVLNTVKRQHPDMPVILMTAYSSLENAAEAIALGAFDYIPKPFDLDAVADIVTDAVAARRFLRSRS
jgi:DNA-binding NtrC family response regulator